MSSRVDEVGEILEDYKTLVTLNSVLNSVDNAEDIAVLVIGYLFKGSNLTLTEAELRLIKELIIKHSHYLNDSRDLDYLLYHRNKMLKKEQGIICNLEQNI